MTTEEFKKILDKGETDLVEFKSWIKAKNQKEIIALAVDELIAFANHKGGTVYFGVEDKPVEVTGCDKNYDGQRIIEGIYDKTRPSLFTEIEDFEYEGKLVIAISVKADGKTYTTTDGRCLKRLGKNSKPLYPDELSNVYSSVQNPDFSGRIISESTLDDVNRLEVYSLKEKLRIRDSKSTLPDLEDIDFLRDLQLTKFDGNVEKLTVAGLLFVGKETSIQRLLPQAEVIYLHYSSENPEEYDARLDMKLPLIGIIDKLTERVQTYSRIENVQVGLFRLEVEEFPERVFQEALLNALSHRDYQSNAAIYVKQYSDRIVIENPGGFLDGITENNIITHPSAPRNKLIAETFQNLKYVQRTGQGVDIIFRDMVSMGKPYPCYKSYNDAVSLTIFSAIDNTGFVKFIADIQDKGNKIMPLAEMMILRTLLDNRREQLSSLADIVQKSLDETRESCNELVNSGLIEIVGKEYMLTAKVYEALKSDVEYTRDKTVQYIKAKNMILEYLQSNDQITSAQIQEMCGFTKQQARVVIDKMREQGFILLKGKGPAARYIRSDELSDN
ncbi:MAG: putative DNA binding domain-containing protein [Clostridiales bacterium]|nr:putative DNA binding domain-containing protein [Clostridiales bacterium]